MRDYKGNGCSHGPVALAHGDLDAPSARPRTGTEGTPHSPRPLHRRGVVLFGDAQAVFAVLRREGRDGGKVEQRTRGRKRDGGGGDRQNETVKLYPWIWQHICSLVLRR